MERGVTKSHPVALMSLILESPATTAEHGEQRGRRHEGYHYQEHIVSENTCELEHVVESMTVDAIAYHAEWLAEWVLKQDVDYDVWERVNSLLSALDDLKEMY